MLASSPLAYVYQELPTPPNEFPVLPVPVRDPYSGSFQARVIELAQLYGKRNNLPLYEEGWKHVVVHAIRRQVRALRRLPTPLQKYSTSPEKENDSPLTWKQVYEEFIPAALEKYLRRWKFSAAS